MRDGSNSNDPPATESNRRVSTNTSLGPRRHSSRLTYRESRFRPLRGFFLWTVSHRSRQNIPPERRRRIPQPVLWRRGVARVRLIWLVSLVLIVTAGASSRDDVGDIRFSISVPTTRRTALAGSVVPFFVEMRNSSLFSVVASAGYRDPPIELHIWNARGEDVVKLPNADLADGSAFKKVPNRRLVAIRFDIGEKVRFQVHIPMHFPAGEYHIVARTAIQPELGGSRSVMLVESNHLPVTLCMR